MRGERWIVLFLLLAASGLAWRDLHRPAIWFDEGWSGWVARMSLEEGLRKAAQDRYPPLRPLLDHMWIRIAGETEFALRWPSSAFALLALALAWRAYYRLRFEPPGGCIGMGAILLSSLWLEQTRQARMYTQAAFLALLSWWTMEDWLRRPGSWHRWGLWLLSSFT
jgi:mannosyltransferase